MNSSCMSCLLSSGGGGRPNLPADEGGISDLQECASGVVPWQTQPSYLACLKTRTGGFILSLVPFSCPHSGLCLTYVCIQYKSLKKNKNKTTRHAYPRSLKDILTLFWSKLLHINKEKSVTCVHCKNPYSSKIQTGCMLV